jgi:cation diffusion facilitator CzcD-associated flavoprotein CzcO
MGQHQSKSQDAPKNRKKKRVLVVGAGAAGVL